MQAPERPEVASDESKWKARVVVLVVVGLFDFVAGGDFAVPEEPAYRGDFAAALFLQC